MHFTDIAILGSGPAGCMAALGALQVAPSLKVTLIDKNTTPRHTIGEALLTGTISTLSEVGIIDDICKHNFHKKIGAAYIWGKSRTPWYVDYPKTPDTPYPKALCHQTGRYALHVPRHLFDQTLREAAQKAGAHILETQIQHIHYTPESDNVLRARTKHGTIRAKHWIDCTGQAAVLTRHTTERKRVWAPRIVKYAYTKDIDWAKAEAAGFHNQRTNIISCTNGWMWIIHLGKAGQDLTSIGFVGTQEVINSLTFHNAPTLFPDLAAFGIKHHFSNPRTVYDTPLADWYHHGDYSHQCTKLHGNNWSSAGDAGLFLDPILSQGATLACHYGMMRGKAAAIKQQENYIRQVSPTLTDHFVTEHYRKEAFILSEIISQWYGNNPSATDWRMKAVNLSQDIYLKNLSQADAFQWLTNLENLREDYHPFHENQRHIIANNLGIRKPALLSN
jgi:flavin-dependent dehydrogenase